MRRQTFDAPVPHLRVPNGRAGRRAVSWSLAGLLVAAAACSPAIFTPPADPGDPAPAASDAWQSAIAPCRTVQSYSALIRLSGRAPRFPTIAVTAAFNAQRAAYLQAQHSGRPLFLLAGDASRASLWLREDHRLVTAPLDQIVDALVGVRLDGADLLAFLSGCPLRDVTIAQARQHRQLLGITTGDGRAFLESIGTAYRVRAAETEGLLLDYGKPAPGWPADVTIATVEPGAPRVELRFRPEQVEVNETLPSAMFAMPAGAASATPMSLEELRKAGPLRR